MIKILGDDKFISPQPLTLVGPSYLPTNSSSLKFSELFFFFWPDFLSKLNEMEGDYIVRYRPGPAKRPNGKLRQFVVKQVCSRHLSPWQVLANRIVGDV